MFYDNAQRYIECVFQCRKVWSKFFRTVLPIRGNDTNNYVECNFLVLKDFILQRMKEYNVNGFIDRFINDF